jgi:hypothetical protein
MKKRTKQRLDFNKEHIRILTGAGLATPRGGGGNYPSDTECGNCGSATGTCPVK